MKYSIFIIQYSIFNIHECCCFIVVRSILDYLVNSNSIPLKFNSTQMIVNSIQTIQTIRSDHIKSDISFHFCLIRSGHRIETKFDNIGRYVIIIIIRTYQVIKIFSPSIV